MDSSGSPSPDHSWLAFSLSNQYYHHPSSTTNNNTTSSTTTNISHQPQLQQQQHQHQHQHLSFFQQHPHLFFPQSQQVDDEVDDGGASRSVATNNNELSFLGTDSGGLLQVGLFPTPEAVTIASTGGGSGSVYDYEQKAIIAQHHHHQQLLQHHQQQQQVQQGERIVDESNKQLAVVSNQPLAPSSTSRKVVEGFGQRTSIYRGVTRHRWTGRYEAHLWDNSCRREGQSRKGRQVYLGGYDKEEKAARAYDLAALKYWGPTTTTNFPISDYEKELEQMKDMSRQEFVASLRRKSSGFSRGASMYRGVTRHHQHGRWQARIGRVAGNKDLYLGTFSTQEEAAEAYDIAAIKFRGLNAVTNFDISRYDVKSIISSNLPVGGMSKNTPKPPTLDHEEIKANEVIKPESLPLLMAANPNQPSTFANHNFVGIPIKSDLSLQNYNWPNLDNTQTPLEYGFGFVQQPSAIGTTNGAMEGYNGYYQDSNNNDNGNDNNNGDDNREVGGGVSGTSSSVSNSWIVAPNLHSLQSPKQNAPVLQTPIFGIE